MKRVFIILYAYYIICKCLRKYIIYKRWYTEKIKRYIYAINVFYLPSLEKYITFFSAFVHWSSCETNLGTFPTIVVILQHQNNGFYFFQHIISRFCYKSILHCWFYFKWHPASAPCWMFQLALAFAWQTWLHFVVNRRFNFAVMNNSERNGLENNHVPNLRSCCVDATCTWYHSNVSTGKRFENWLRFVVTTQASGVQLVRVLSNGIARCFSMTISYSSLLMISDFY